MQTLLAILLYMQLIHSPGTYSQIQINQLEMQYHAQIQIIQNDPAQMSHINQIYLPQTERITVINPWETSIEKPLRDFCCEKKNKVLIGN